MSCSQVMMITGSRATAFRGTHGASEHVLPGWLQSTRTIGVVPEVRPRPQGIGSEYERSQLQKSSGLPGSPGTNGPLQRFSWYGLARAPAVSLLPVPVSSATSPPFPPPPVSFCERGRLSILCFSSTASQLAPERVSCCVRTHSHFVRACLLHCITAAFCCICIHHRTSCRTLRYDTAHSDKTEPSMNE
jgi:hypothetical protein